MDAAHEPGIYITQDLRSSTISDSDEDSSDSEPSDRPESEDAEQVPPSRLTLDIHNAGQLRSDADLQEFHGKEILGQIAGSQPQLKPLEQHSQRQSNPLLLPGQPLGKLKPADLQIASGQAAAQQKNASQRSSDLIVPFSGKQHHQRLLSLQEPIV